MTTRPPANDRPSVLLVDDDPEQLRMLEIFLRSQFAVTTATSAKEAADKLRQGPRPAVLVTDLDMPETHGVSFILWIRKRPELQGMPIVALSGLGRSDAVVASIKAGATAFLEKPVTSERLAELLTRLAHRAAA